MADCPWPETGGGNRGTDAHYETVPYDSMPALVMGASCWRPARNFWCGLWTTKASVDFTHTVMLPALGLTYVTTWTWIKLSQQGELRLGMGQYGRHGVEFLVWAKRGVVGRNEGAWQKAEADFARPVGEHSEKPDFAYEQALRVFKHGRALAMYERKHRPGFHCYGNQLPPLPGQLPPVV
jgi:N6-adenosine-specific RNA methylase IME4